MRKKSGIYTQTKFLAEYKFIVKETIRMEPGKGLLTFRSEGNNIKNSRYYSRKIHWPGINSKFSKYVSGVTIGRGYDMKYRSSSEIIHHLTLAGISLEKAKKFPKQQENITA